MKRTFAFLVMADLILFNMRRIERLRILLDGGLDISDVDPVAKLGDYVLLRSVF
jgi:hypothetical protein